MTLAMAQEFIVTCYWGRDSPFFGFLAASPTGRHENEHEALAGAGIGLAAEGSCRAIDTISTSMLSCRRARYHFWDGSRWPDANLLFLASRLEMIANGDSALWKIALRSGRVQTNARTQTQFVLWPRHCRRVENAFSSSSSMRREDLIHFLNISVTERSSRCLLCQTCGLCAGMFATSKSRLMLSLIFSSFRLSRAEKIFHQKFNLVSEKVFFRGREGRRIYSLHKIKFEALQQELEERLQNCSSGCFVSFDEWKLFMDR